MVLNGGFGQCFSNSTGYLMPEAIEGAAPLWFARMGSRPVRFGRSVGHHRSRVIEATAGTDWLHCPKLSGTISTIATHDSMNSTGPRRQTWMG